METDLIDNNQVSSDEEPAKSKELEDASTSEPKADDVVLKVDNVSKKFCRNLKRSMLYGIQDLAKGMVGIEPDTTTLRKDEFWALKDINFELRKGEVLGIIGANGSGKSTLLRVLTGIFPPDKGKIVMNGTVGGIIALGAGMHPHMTGRENIYLNGTIMGMTREEIDEKFDDIVDFAEIGDFLDAPLSTYSSGMKVRLGFAVAIQFDPNILLIDEVLAVGDTGFKKKSMNRISSILDTKSVIFISHDMSMVSKICNRLIVLSNGRIIYNSENVSEGIIKYQSMFNDDSIDTWGVENIELVNSRFIDGNIISHDDETIFEIDLKLNDDKICSFVVNIVVKNASGDYVLAMQSQKYNSIFINNNGIAKIQVTMKVILTPGRYSLALNINEPESNGVIGKKLARIENVNKFYVKPNTDVVKFGSTPVSLTTEWEQIK
ncbi:MAG: ABC transporter ATP-binding protein [Bacteroidota bacterium]